VNGWIGLDTRDFFLAVECLSYVLVCNQNKWTVGYIVYYKASAQAGIYICLCWPEPFFNAVQL